MVALQEPAFRPAAGGTAQTDKFSPSTRHQPYRVIRDWAQLKWKEAVGRLHGVAIDREGRSVWPPIMLARTARLLSTKANPVHHFDETGKRSGALAAGCSCGRMASMSIEMECVGTRRRAERESRRAQEISGEENRAALSPVKPRRKSS